MDYSVSKGDNLWNIVKNNYNTESNKDIINIINEIVKDNNIKDPNLIFAGSTISLPENDKFIKQENNSSEDEVTETSRADAFAEWSSDENIDKINDGQEVEDFQMFDLNLATYSSDLKEFAQEVIDKYDEDNDGQLNKNEFKNMAMDSENAAKTLEEDSNTIESYIELYQKDIVDPFDENKDGKLDKKEFTKLMNRKAGMDNENWDEAFAQYASEEDPDHISAEDIIKVEVALDTETAEKYTNYQINKMLDEKFADLNIDSDMGNINAKEYAAMLAAADIDWGNYNLNNFAEVIDGKLNYVAYQTLPSLEGDSHTIWMKEKSDFYNDFYADNN